MKKIVVVFLMMIFLVSAVNAKEICTVPKSSQSGNIKYLEKYCVDDNAVKTSNTKNPIKRYTGTCDTKGDPSAEKCLSQYNYVDYEIVHTLTKGAQGYDYGLTTIQNDKPAMTAINLAKGKPKPPTTAADKKNKKNNDAATLKKMQANCPPPDCLGCIDTKGLALVSYSLSSEGTTIPLGNSVGTFYVDPKTKATYIVESGKLFGTPVSRAQVEKALAGKLKGQNSASFTINYANSGREVGTFYEQADTGNKNVIERLGFSQVYYTDKNNVKHYIDYYAKKGGATYQIKDGKFTPANKDKLKEVLDKVNPVWVVAADGTHSLNNYLTVVNENSNAVANNKVNKVKTEGAVRIGCKPPAKPSTKERG